MRKTRRKVVVSVVIIVIAGLTLGAVRARVASAARGASLESTLSVTKWWASSEYREDAEFVLVNSTSEWLSLFVDGERTVTVNPGDRGVVLVAVGTHTFRAEASDGRSVQRTAYVPPEGMTWTISEEK